MVRCDRAGFKTLQGVGLGVGILGLAACGSTMDMATIEQTIKADIERQGRRLTLQKVSCPENVPPQAGAYFRCVGRLESEETFTINVIQDDSQGNVTWEVPNSRVMLNLAKVEANIQSGLTEAFGKRALIDCGSELYRVNQPGDRFECSIIGGLTVGPATYSTVLVKVNADGNLNWQENRQGNPATTVASTPPAGRTAPTGAPPTNAEAPTADTPRSETSSAPVKTTTVNGPSGRVVERPYVPGDDD